MRFSILIGGLAALAAVAGRPSPAPVSVSSEGEPVTHVIHLKDIDPKAPNGELVLGKIIISPNTTSATSATRLKKRQVIIYGQHWVQCNNPANHWINQWMLYAALPGICNWLDSNWQIGYGSSAEVWWQHYQDGNGNWIHLQDVNGNTNIQTKWNLFTPSGRGWNWSDCYNVLFQLIWSCPGNNPDTAGGFLNDYVGNDWSARLQIYDL